MSSKLRKDLFWSVDQWLETEDSNLLDDKELYWLHIEAKNARIALERRLEVVLDQNNKVGILDGNL